ncbi:TlpA family protein disulfide reductase [Mucilaginibacter myungsuensis]|uniref:TlpA family protein disulfide reductase n=1 Tax=Mucilaginibacter myungsuensis TaxID=649104 RepID=A0A929KX86_9SPHI|nr:TlpA disulfide reductase family protein [Mucilaginibacter myungsuensis]MBE9661613.1 TlpA family protein disulfide reductase [Mucilaginibacter myungsuensis]MDN3597757.1 TlpA disulfide reductase family protein [Mucilaginibacter myungsuensis]
MKQLLNLKTQTRSLLTRCVITLACTVVLGTPAAIAQTLKLKPGQQFSYETMERYVIRTQEHSSKNFYYSRYNYLVSGIEGDNYVIKVSPQQYLADGINGIVFDSSAPSAEQENELLAVVQNAVSKLNFTIVVNKTGKLMDIRDTAGAQAFITAKLTERNTFKVKNHDIIASEGPQVNYLDNFIYGSAQVFKASVKQPAGNNVTKAGAGVRSVRKKDAETGLIVISERDSTANKIFADTNKYESIKYSHRLQMVKGNVYPVYAEASRTIGYDNYYTPLNKAKRKLAVLLDEVLNNKGALGMHERAQRSIDSLDKLFKPDDWAYQGAKVYVLGFIGSNEYIQLLEKVPYAYLEKDGLVNVKLGRQLANGNTTQLRTALQILFTKMLWDKKYPSNVDNLCNDIHDNLGKQVKNAKDPRAIKKILDALMETEQLRIHAVNEILAGLKTYCRVKLATDAKQLTPYINFNYNSLYDKASRYRMLIFDELIKKQVPDSILTAYNDYTIEMVKGNIAAINSGDVPGMSKYRVEPFLGPRRVLYKKYLAEAYYRKSLLQKDRSVAYLQMAVDYLPNQQDLMNNRGGFERENAYVASKPYKELYMKAAESGALSPEQLLKQYVDLVVIEPERYPSLKEKYIKSFPAGDFKKFFNDALKEKLPSTPDFTLNDRSGKQLAMKDQKDKFTFVDFWGTWCGACVDEIHRVEALYKKGIAPGKLTVTTIACFDKKKNVDDFMEARKYTYPVLMSDGKVEKDFKVIGYPTKLLLLPNGTYLDIPYQADYKPIVEKYLAWEM